MTARIGLVGALQRSGDLGVAADMDDDGVLHAVAKARS
ncbi:hypothetical protein BKA19_0629 [Blastococcus saxobsidens]|uniref:Uncharacterized protein n=1 Tax=Blastococcus saxobsidens TaxID=138336 RepID=A0A4Q7Y2F7_9ACTN|nr:hypothetical protein BKA19_0629 [Blastococcus saxobsidens]